MKLDLTDRREFEWQCIKCRTIWRQQCWLGIRFACTVCNPPLYASASLYPVRET